MITCELREDVEKSLEILEECYTQNQENFSDEGFALWATNMAYFLIEEDRWEESQERAVQLLLQAINHNSNYASTYYGYGKVHYGKKNFEKASKLFNKAFELSPIKSYKYCEAVSLLANSNQKEGISQLKSIYSYPFGDEGIDVQIAFTLGRELALSGNIEDARNISKILLKTDYEKFDIDISDMADFMFILGDYKTCVELYDKYTFAADASWLNTYFYALKQIGQTRIAEKKLEGVTQEIEDKIYKEITNPIDWESNEKLQSYIDHERKGLQDIIECYNKVFTHAIEVVPDIYYGISYMCYYITCPRHYSKS